MAIDACLSSKRMNWGTPKAIYDRYNQEFNFDLDAAADFTNTKCPRFIGPPGYGVGPGRFTGFDCEAVDALNTPRWPGERVWLNPPYGRGIKDWYRKVHEQVTEFGLIVVMLVPSRTDTKYWHDYVWDADLGIKRPWVQRIDYLKGRIKFEGAAHGAPFPSAVIVFIQN